MITEGPGASTDAECGEERSNSTQTKPIIATLVQKKPRKTYEMFKIVGCGPGQYVSGNQCESCGVGTFQDQTFHKNETCINCSGKWLNLGYNVNIIYWKFLLWKNCTNCVSFFHKVDIESVNQMITEGPGASSDAECGE